MLWFLGAAGLAAAPPFATMLGEAGAPNAAELAGVPGVSFLFLFAGIMTGAAVSRVGMHTFLGWGDKPLTDRAADVGELPETKAEDQKIFWYHFTPAAICILGAALSSGLRAGSVSELFWRVVRRLFVRCRAAILATTCYGSPSGWRSLVRRQCCSSARLCLRQ